MLASKKIMTLTPYISDTGSNTPLPDAAAGEVEKKKKKSSSSKTKESSSKSTSETKASKVQNLAGFGGCPSPVTRLC
jgi:hypothetical protein